MTYHTFNNFLKILFIVGILILASIYIYQYPRPHSDVISGLEYDHVRGLIVEEIEIEIEGSISKRLFGKDFFIGSIKIDEFEFNFDKGNFLYLDYKDFYQSLTQFTPFEQGVYIGDMISYGAIYTNDNLSEVIIIKYERKGDGGGGSFSSYDGSIVYGPSKTKKDIMDGITSLIKNTFFEDLKIVW